MEVLRQNDGVQIKTVSGTQKFDAVIFASHSDQTLKLLRDASEAEQKILGAIRYQTNEVALHEDASLMPKNKRAWASWNYADQFFQSQASLTYYMNRLQAIDSKRPLFVTVNLHEGIAPEKILFKTQYQHPVLNQAAYRAQKEFELINGKNRSFFCGAYWGHGFHEDGVNSALKTINAVDAYVS
jgi:hypothetical protein